MADNILGFIATIDITNLKAGLSQVKDAVGQAKQQFETSTASLEKWQKSSQGVGAKLEQLNTVLKAQEKSVEAYENEIKRVSEKEGDHSKQLEILERKLQSAKNSIEKTKASIETYSKSYETLKKKEQEESSQNSKLNKALEEQKNKLKELENQYKSAVLQNGKYSKEAKTIATEVKKATKELKAQEKQVEELEKDFKKLTNASENYKKLGKTLLTGVTALAGAFAGLVSGLSKASESTEDFRQNQTRLEATFKQQGLSVETLNSQYEKLFRVLGDDSQTTEALTYLTQFAKTEEDLNKWTSTLIGTYAKFGKSLPTQELAKNINQAIQTSEVSGQLADAIKQTGGSVESLKSMLSMLTDEQSKEQLILSYLQDNYNKLGEEYEKNNKEILKSNEANLQYTKSLAKIGELGTSVKTSLVNLKAQALEKLYPLIEKTINFTTKNFKTLATITGTIAGVGTALITLSASIKTYNILVKTATALQTAWNAVLNSNPVGLVITAIAGLAVGLTVLIKNWEKVKEIATSCWGEIKEVWEGASSFFTSLGESIKNIFLNTWEKIKNTWSETTSFFQRITEKTASFFSKAWENIKEIFANPGEFFSQVVEKIVKTFAELPNKLLELGKKAVLSLRDGMVNTWNSIKGTVSDFFSGNTIQATVKPEIEEDNEYYKKVGERFAKNIKELANKYNVSEGLVLNITTKLKGQATWEEVENILKNLQSKTDTTSQSIQEAIQETTENVISIEGQAQEVILEQQQESQNQQLSATENFIKSQIEKLKEKYQNEIQLASNTQEQTEIKKKYQNELGTIESFYNSWEAQSGQTNENIKSDLTTLKGEFTTTLDTINSSIEKNTQSWQERFKQTMSSVVNTVNKYTSKITSYISQITSQLNEMWQQQIDNIDKEWEAYEDEYEKKKEQAEAENEEELERIQEQYDAQLELLETQRDAELDENARAYQEGLIDDKQYFANKYKIMAKYNDKEEKAALEKDATVSDSGRQLTDYLKQLEDEKLAKEQEMLRLKNEAARKQFEAQKANDIANVWIQSAVAILKAFADLGPIGGAIETAVILALAGTQTALIASKQFTPYTELAEGGIIDKPTYALVGEDGKEAVMPLKNNTEWISQLAEKLNELQSKDFTIDNLRGQRQQVINNYETSNNYNYEQNITSPKALTRSEIYKDSKSLLSLKKYK